MTRLGLAAAYRYLDSGVLPDTEPDCAMQDMDLALRSIASLPSVALEIGRQKGFLSTSTAAVGHSVSRLNNPIPSMLNKIEISLVVNAGVAPCTPAAAIFQNVYVSSGPKLSNLFATKKLTNTATVPLSRLGDSGQFLEDALKGLRCRLDRW